MCGEGEEGREERTGREGKEGASNTPWIVNEGKGQVKGLNGNANE